MRNEPKDKDKDYLKDNEAQLEEEGDFRSKKCCCRFLLLYINLVTQESLKLLRNNDSDWEAKLGRKNE